MTVSQGDYRDAMARLGAAVTIITSGGAAGRCGFTASAVCSVTDAPPTLLVCVNRSNDSHSILAENRVMCVNVLTDLQRALSPVFAGVGDLSQDDRFQHGDWDRFETDSPVLQGAAVSFDCRITDAVTVGTHDVFFGEVVLIRSGDRHAGLIYYGRNYHPVTSGT